MARWFVALWFIALVGGVTLIIVTRPDNPIKPPQPALAVKGELNNVFANVPALVNEFIACRQECQMIFDKPGGLSNTAIVLDYSLAEVTTARRCQRTIIKLRNTVDVISEQAETTPKKVLRRFARESTQAAQACQQQNLPIRR